MVASIAKRIWRLQWHHHISPWVTLKGQSQVTQISKTCKGAELGHVLLLNINRKAYNYGESIGAITFDLSDLERSMSRPLRIRRLISLKGAELGHMLLSNINRKSYGESSNTVTFDLSHLERPMSRSLRFWKLRSRKRVDVANILLLNIGRKPLWWYGVGNHPVTLITFDLEWHWKVKLKVTQISKRYIPWRSRVTAYVTIKHK